MLLCLGASSRAAEGQGQGGSLGTPRVQCLFTPPPHWASCLRVSGIRPALRARGGFSWRPPGSAPSHTRLLEGRAEVGSRFSRVWWLVGGWARPRSGGGGLGVAVPRVCILVSGWPQGPQPAGSSQAHSLHSSLVVDVDPGGPEGSGVVRPSTPSLGPQGLWLRVQGLVRVMQSPEGPGLGAGAGAGPSFRGRCGIWALSPSRGTGGATEGSAEGAPGWDSAALGS